MTTSIRQQARQRMVLASWLFSALLLAGIGLTAPNLAVVQAQRTTPTPCATLALTITPARQAGAATPAPCTPTVTAQASISPRQATLTARAILRQVSPSPTPPAYSRSGTAALGLPASPIPYTPAAGTVIGPTFATIIDGDAAGFLAAINYSNSLIGNEPPYQIYLLGSRYDLSRLVVPTVTRSIEIYGKNSLIIVSAQYPFIFNGKRNVLSSVIITQAR